MSPIEMAVESTNRIVRGLASTSEGFNVSDYAADIAVDILNVSLQRDLTESERDELMERLAR